MQVVTSREHYVKEKGITFLVQFKKNLFEDRIQVV
jgi:hypothetical protein